MILHHRKFDRGGLPLVIGFVEVDREGISIVVDMIDRIADRLNVRVVAVRNAEIDPLERADRVVEDFPFDIVIHVERRVRIDVDGDRKFQDLVCRVVGIYGNRSEENDEQKYGREQPSSK